MVDLLVRVMVAFANNVHVSTGQYKIFRPVVDGTLVTDFPTLTILGGGMADVPVIVG